MPDELNETLAEKIGRACGEFLKPAKMVVGHDIRLSSPTLSDAVAKGLVASGCDVVDIGLRATKIGIPPDPLQQLGRLGHSSKLLRSTGITARIQPTHSAQP